MIPKIIHYCWFGGKEKPDDVKHCIQSWKKALPDYKIVEWNETNFDVNDSVIYVKEAYQDRKWAFVSDYVRLIALYEHGGIYLDTDVEVFKSFDNLLDNSCFFGFESKDYIASAVMGCEPQSIIVEEFIDTYKKRRFIDKYGKIDTTTNVIILTRLLEKKGLRRNGEEQTILENIKIFPQFYFASNDLINIWGRYNKKIYAYHHCLASWYDHNRGTGMKELVKHYFVGVLRNTIGTDTLRSVKRKFMRAKS